VIEDGLTVVSLVGQDPLGVSLSEQFDGLGAVVDLTAGPRKSTGRPISLASRWIFVVRPPRERPRALSAPPFLRPVAACWWGTHDRRIDHQIKVFAIDHQVAKDLVPHSTCRPAAEPLVHALVLAVALGKIMPMSAGAQNPEHPVDKNAVVRSRTAYRFHSPWQQTLDPRPLRISQLIATHAQQSRKTNQSRDAKSICRYRLVNSIYVWRARASPASPEIASLSSSTRMYPTKMPSHPRGHFLESINQSSIFLTDSCLPRPMG